MASNGFPPEPEREGAGTPARAVPRAEAPLIAGAGEYPPEAAERAATPTRDRYWLHVLLFLVTILSTTILGARFAYNFNNNLPPFSSEGEMYIFLRIWRDPWMLVSGLPYSLTLLAILTAHEMGHYLACLFYRVDASLPYFIPFPSFIGTFGAFIRIRAPVYTRKALFDIGIAGPVAGFLLLVPAFGAGLAMSKVIPGVANSGDITFGRPLLQWILEALIFPGVNHNYIYLHPIARAAWVGVLATALNLLPIGQLDGGHVLYALAGRLHKKVSTVFILLLIPLGFLYTAWWIWGAIFYFLGRRHFPIYDASPISPGRLRLAWATVAIFLLCFIPAPLVLTSIV